MGDLPWIEVIYWASAIIGGTLFVLRTILMFAGIGMDDGHIDLHADDLGDFDADADAGGMNFSFSLLSLQGLTAFFTMFGLIGLTLLKAGLHVLLTILGGTIAGLFTVFIISLIFAQVGRFQSEGNLNIQNAVGQTGSVYLRIPEGGSGQVQVSVQGGLRILDAVTEDGGALPSGARVRVTGVQDSNTVIVVNLN
jgi:membrane protein implicated in regulation of membrane protease activity